MANHGIIAIPARMASTRLPNKLLLDKTGKPLLAHVVDRALEAQALKPRWFGEVVVATDHPMLAAIAERAGVRAVMTGEHHRCGTTRIAEAVDAVDPGGRFDFVVNVQGDEPELAPEAIVEVAETLLDCPSASMSTLVVAMPVGTDSMKHNPAAVKAVLDDTGRAIYFSRSPIPHDRNPAAKGDALWHLHLGVYAYRRSFLGEFAAMTASSLEVREGLEQLRAIQSGRLIQAACVPWEWAGKGIDTPEDYDAFVRRAAA